MDCNDQLCMYVAVSEVFRWDKCIISEGGYFEGDKIVIDK